MANNRQNSSGRFPHFKLFLFLALVFTLGMTVISANTKTNIHQHAASVTCGPNGQAPLCPNGYSCSYTAGNPDFGGTCIPASVSAAPTSLYASYTNCINYGITFSARITLSWSKVSNATDYRVTLSDSVGTIYLSTTGTSITTSNYSFATGKSVYWYVQGHNKYSGSYGPRSITKYITFSCNK